MPPQFNANSHVIQTYFETLKSGYMNDLPEGELFRETPLFSTTITQVISDPLTAIRTPSVARNIPEDYCSFIVLEAGRGYWSDREVEHLLMPSTVLFVEAARPFTFHFTQAYRVMSFNVPRELIAKHFQDMPSHGGISRTCSNIIRGLLSSLNQLALIQDEEIHARLARAIEVNLLSQFEALFIHQLAAKSKEGKPSLALVKSKIESQALDEGFTIECLLESCRISRRYLFKLFEAEPLSLQQYIQTVQLHHAFQLLVDLESEYLQVGDVACQCGFKTQAHFSRLFKQRFEITPTALRQQLIAAKQRG